jgi:hypothetical protein
MKYIAYNKMNPAEQLLFNSTGKVDEKYLLTDAQWEAELAKIDCEDKTQQESVS